jgi:hypothetical protein
MRRAMLVHQPMDLSGTIRSLRAELARIDAAIAALQGVGSATGAGATPPRSKRGRKSMAPEERQVVAERMRRYWAQRRKQKKKAG